VIEPECGVTQVSLSNGRALLAEHGFPCWVRLHDDSECTTVVGYPDGHQHVFTGFGWGYGGEGPHGLAEWATENRVPLSFDEVVRLSGTGDVWKWPRAILFQVWHALNPSFLAGGHLRGERRMFFHVRLESFGYQKINVIKAMREIVPGLGLKMAKDLVEAAPATLRDTAGRDLLLPEDVAHQHVARLRAAGARADVVEES